MIVILEPDSLANLATNLGLEGCAAAEGAYRRGIAYAISKLSLPNVSIYLDAAHGGWLGWKRNLTKIAEIFRSVLDAAGGSERIRGFAVNVANYNPTKVVGGRRGSPSDPGPDELSYVDDLRQALSEVGLHDKGFVIDTARNGRLGIRANGADWCNIARAGLGERPTSRRCRVSTHTCGSSRRANRTARPTRARRASIPTARHPRRCPARRKRASCSPPICWTWSRTPTPRFKEDRAPSPKGGEGAGTLHSVIALTSEGTPRTPAGAMSSKTTRDPAGKSFRAASSVACIGSSPAGTMMSVAVTPQARCNRRVVSGGGNRPGSVAAAGKPTDAAR